MRLLLDTHLLLWALIEPDNLPRQARVEIEKANTVVLFSAVSIWEIAIKTALKRPSFNVDAAQVFEAALASGMAELPVFARAAAQVMHLPHHHGDPFDRLLIAQAMMEPAVLLTVDRQLPVYSELVRHVG